MSDQSPGYESLRDLTRRYERDWHQGNRLPLEAYLGASPSTEAVVELAHTELELRLRAGYSARAGDYLRFAAFRDDADAFAELVLAEFAHRRDHREPHLQPSHILTQYPDLSTVLSSRLGPDAPAAGGPAVVTPGDWPVVPGCTLVQRLGGGSFGEVYLARNAALGRREAVKVLRRVGEDARQRFRRETQALAQLKHPHIVEVYQAGEDGGLPYFAMEYLPDGNVHELLQLGPAALPFAQAAEKVKQLAEAVEHAHRAGVIHRDIKPANVLVAADGTWKLADFGLAKWREAGETLTAQQADIGTPGYMAPEQYGSAKDAGPAADVYGLGALIYRLLAGHATFIGTPAEVMHQTQNADPVPPSRVRAGVPRDLETICLKCLEREPSRRYATAQQLANDLGRFLRGEAVRARRAGPVEKATRWARRNPALSFAMTAVILSLTAGTVVSLSLAESYRKARDEAEGRSRELERQGQVLEKTNATILRSVYNSEFAGNYRETLLNGRVDRASWNRLKIGPGESTPMREWDFLDQRTREQPVLWMKLSGSGTVSSIKCSRDGKWLAAAKGKSIHLIDRATKRVSLLSGHQDVVTNLDFHPDSSKFASCSQDKTIRIWDVSDPQKHKVLKGHQYTIWSVAFDRSGDKLVSPASPNWSGDTKPERPSEVFEWDLQTGRPERSITDGLGAFSAGHWRGGVLIGSSHDRLRYWRKRDGDAKGGPESERSLLLFQYGDGEPEQIRALCISPDEKWTAVRTHFGLYPLRIIDDQARIHLELPTSILDDIMGIFPGIQNSWSFDSRRLAVLTKNALVELDFTHADPTLRDGRRKVSESRIWHYTADDPAGRIYGVASSPDGRWFLVKGTNDLNAVESTDEIYLWDPAHLGSLNGALTSTRRALKAVAFSENGRLAVTSDKATGSAEAVFRLWRRQGLGWYEHASLWTDEGSSDALAASPKAEMVAFTTSGNGHRLYLWKRDSRRPVRLCDDNKRMASLVFSPNSRWLAFASDRRAGVYDVSTGKIAGEFFTESPVNALAFSPDSHSLLIASEGVTDWNFASGGKAEYHPGKVVSDILASPDGRSFIQLSGSSLASINRQTMANTMLRDGFTSLNRIYAYSKDARTILAGVAERSPRTKQPVTVGRTIDPIAMEVRATLTGQPHFTSLDTDLSLLDLRFAADDGLILGATEHGFIAWPMNTEAIKEGRLSADSFIGSIHPELDPNSNRVVERLRAIGRISATASSSSGPLWEPGRLIDGSLGTSWFSNAGDSIRHDLSPWVELQFADPVSIRRLSVVGDHEPNLSNATYAVQRFVVEAFDARDEPIKVFTLEAMNAAGDADHRLEVPVKGVRRLRLSVRMDDGDKNPFGSIALGEILLDDGEDEKR